MDLFRFTNNVFGQKMLVGVNWEYIWVPLVVAGAIIGGHIVLRLLFKHE